MATAGFTDADKACHLIVQTRNNFWKSSNPGSGPLPLRKSHFHGVLVPEQALSQGVVETFNNGLVAVNFSAPASDICFVFFHLFCDSAHEFAPRINLQHFWPRQRAALANVLKSFRNFIRIFRRQWFGLFVAAGHVDNGERVSENFAPAGQFVVRHEKKVRLVDPVGCWNVKLRARNSLRRGEVDLPKSLLEEPPLRYIFRHFRSLS